MSTVKVKDQICHVETLSEWIERRIKQVVDAQNPAISRATHTNMCGRLAELRIIEEKINDGRIQEIGKVKFKKKVKR